MGKANGLVQVRKRLGGWVQRRLPTWHLAVIESNKRGELQIAWRSVEQQAGKRRPKL